MKHTVLFLLLFCWASAFGQTPIFTAGITYCNGIPSHNPGNTGSRYAVDTVNWDVYTRTVTNNWIKVGDWLQNISGCSAPAYTPTKFQSVFVVNNCTPPELYYYTGAAWEQLGGSGGADTLRVFDPGIGGEMWATVSGGGDTLKIIGGTNIDVSPGGPGEVVITNVATGLTNGDKGDIDVSGTGSTVWKIDTAVVGPLELASTAVTPGSYTNTSLTVDADGRITAASSGAAGVTGSGLANRLAYWTAAGAMGYESTLLVDSTNNRLMIGSQTAPTSTLHVFGTSRFIPGSDNNQGADLTIVSQYSRLNFFNTAAYALGGEITCNKNMRLYSTGAVANYISSGAAGPTSTSENFLRINGSYLGGKNLLIGSSGGVSPFASGAWGLINTFDGNFSSTAYAASLVVRAGNSNSGCSGGNCNGGSVAISGGTATGSGLNGFVALGYNGSSHVSNVLIGHITNDVYKIDVNSGGTTSANGPANFANSLDSTILRVRSDRRVGINTTTPDVSLDAGENTDAIKIPAGTTAQEPAVNNTLRFNTSREALEARENGVMYRLTSSRTPSVAAGAAAGTTPTIAVAGSDLAGKVTLTTGTGATTGALFTVTYASSVDASSNYYITFSCADADCPTLQLYVSAESNTSFTVSTVNAPADGVQYIINYNVAQ